MLHSFKGSCCGGGESADHTNGNVSDHICGNYSIWTIISNVMLLFLFSFTGSPNRRFIIDQQVGQIDYTHIWQSLLSNFAPANAAIHPIVMRCYAQSCRISFSEACCWRHHPLDLTTAIGRWAQKESNILWYCRKKISDTFRTSIMPLICSTSLGSAV